MHAFTNTQPVSLVNAKFFRRYPEGILTAETPVDKLIIDAAGESKILIDHFKALKDEAEKKGEDASAMGELQIVGESQLVKWQHLPSRLGRVSAKLLADELHHHEELAPLAMQCDILRSKKLGKKHFRIAIVNAFGANLGDTTLGMTALRMVAKTFQEKFESFSIDFFLGPSSHQANRQIIDCEPWVEHVRYESPTVQDFSRYDAYLDFTNLINLPKFHDMPTVDWYLWWMGLEPTSVDAADKRNRLSIPWKTWREVAELLKGRAGQRVLLNAKASVPLRTFPLDLAAKWLRKLLDDQKDMQLIVSHELDLKHPRLLAVHDKLPTAEHFMALVAQVDAVITVDTFAVHAADAASVPCVSLFASVPPTSYPYYPLNEGMLIPGGEDLPGYKKSKNNSDEEWASMEEGYRKAWAKLGVSPVVKALKLLGEKKKSTSLPTFIKLRNEPEVKSGYAWKNGAYRFKHANPSLEWKETHEKLSSHAAAILRPGMACVLYGAGAPDLPLAISRKIGVLGKLHVVEPRKHCAALLGMNLANEIATGQVTVHRTMAAKAQRFVQFDAADPYSEVDPAQWGNMRQQERVGTLKMEEIDLPHCQLMVIQLPMPVGFIVESALEFIEKHKPSIAVGPIDKEGLRPFLQMLEPLEYTVWAEPATHNQKTEQFCVLAFPKDKKVNMRGFKQVRL